MHEAGGEVSLSPHCEGRPVPFLDYRHLNDGRRGGLGGPGCRKPDGRCAGWRNNPMPACFARPRR